MKGDGSGKKQLTKRRGIRRRSILFAWTERNWYGERPTGTTPRLWRRYKELLRENLTEPMKMEIVVANRRRQRSEADHELRLRSFAPTFTPDGKKDHLCRRTSTIAMAAVSSSS